VSDALERVLRLVAEGRLSAEDAAPILDALEAAEAASTRGSRVPGTGPSDGGGPSEAWPVGPGPAEGGSPGGAKFARIMVMEGGRRVVDLRIPTSLGHFALGRVPGLSTDQVDELRQAISTGRTGPLLDIEDVDGDGVKIVLE
jgi:hypothetical protein